jgi:hypothetical protein
MRPHQNSRNAKENNRGCARARKSSYPGFVTGGWSRVPRRSGDRRPGQTNAAGRPQHSLVGVTMSLKKRRTQPNFASQAGAVSPHPHVAVARITRPEKRIFPMPTAAPKCFYCGGDSSRYEHHPHYCVSCAQLVDHIVAWYAQRPRPPKAGALEAVLTLARGRIRRAKNRTAAGGGR